MWIRWSSRSRRRMAPAGSRHSFPKSHELVFTTRYAASVPPAPSASSKCFSTLPTLPSVASTLKPARLVPAVYPESAGYSQTVELMASSFPSSTSAEGRRGRGAIRVALYGTCRGCPFAGAPNGAAPDGGRSRSPDGRPWSAPPRDTSARRFPGRPGRSSASTRSTRRSTVTGRDDRIRGWCGGCRRHHPPGSLPGGRPSHGSEGAGQRLHPCSAEGGSVIDSVLSSQLARRVLTPAASKS